MKKTVITIMLILSITGCSLLPGCGIVRGTGRAIGSVCQGVGEGIAHIGQGIEEDSTAASDGHAKEYTKNYTN